MSTSVKFLHSAMTGAPTLSGTAGHLIAVLDACLVNGFGSGNLDSLVIASGIATATRSAGHPFEVGSVAEIAGATVSGGSVNGQKKVLSVTSTTYTFDATGISNQTATGTITHKMAALGWTKEFSGTNLAVYTSPNVASTGCRLRVDDTGTTSARVVGYETMSDVNTGTGPFPTSAQSSGGGYWAKSSVASTATRDWMVFGDDRGFYVFINHLPSNATGAATLYFGDYNSRRSPDPYACLLTAATATYITSGQTTAADIARMRNDGNSSSAWSPRSYTGLGSSAEMTRSVAALFNASITPVSGSGDVPYPNSVDNGLLVAPIFLGEVANQALRATLPGVYFTPQNIVADTFATRESVTGVTGLSGKRLRAITAPALTSIFFADDTGPWR